MSRKVTEDQKKSILEEFTNGLDVKDISKTFNFTIATINRQLRNMLGEETFLKIKKSNFKKNSYKNIDEKINNITSFSNSSENNKKETDNLGEFPFKESDYYVEISP